MRKGRDSNPRYAKRTTVFETAPIDHSGTFPVLPSGLLPKSGCKVRANFPLDKIFSQIFQPLDGLNGVVSAKDVTACNQDIGACLGQLGSGDVVHAAINLDLCFRTIEGDELPQSNPGLTDMSSTRSTSQMMSLSMATGVAGLRATPACMPASWICCTTRLRWIQAS